MVRGRSLFCKTAAVTIPFLSVASAACASQAADQPSGTGAAFAALVLVALAFFLYFLPAFVGRRKQNFGAIFVLNLLLGWTLIGWVVALVWAVAKETASTQVIVNQPPLAASVFCRSCGKYSQAGSRFCASCGAPTA
jgi:MYXO-CTERM domain-containing protein